jgi:heme/copper-type cytochrome/quinol oxidase subunit 1
MLAATTVKAIGVVICAITIIGFVVYVLINVRAGRPEIASRSSWPPTASPTTTTSSSRARASTGPSAAGSS